MSTIVQPAPVKLAKPTLPKGDSCLLVIFGATGDLTRRKLIPALYDLACVGCTSRDFDVLGIGRTKLTDDEFRAHLRDGAANSKDTRNFSDDGWNDFAKRLHYLIGDANQRDFYPQLKAKIEEMQKNGASQQHLVLRFHAGLARSSDRGRSGLGWSGAQYRRLDTHHPGEALRPRPAKRARVERDCRACLRRAIGLSHRPLSGQRDGAEHHDVPLRQLDVRAGVEPQLHRIRRDHGCRETRRREPRRLLRGDRGAARHGRQPHAAVADAHRDGAAGHLRRRFRARTQGGSAARDSCHVEGRSREAHGSRPVRTGADRRQACPRLSPGAGRQS